jgi:hypothetical protein
MFDQRTLRVRPLRTAEQDAIARLWSDDPGVTATPPGHSISVTTQVLRREEASLVDPSWLPRLVTPPFPEYPSGHSVQSGAAFQVLTDLFGDGYAFLDQTHDNRGLQPRSVESFLEAADEAAISRI